MRHEPLTSAEQDALRRYFDTPSDGDCFLAYLVASDEEVEAARAERGPRPPNDADDVPF